MNTKLFTTITVLAAVSGSTVLFTGCQPEWEPMPPGVYIQPVEKDPERVDIPKTDTVLPAPPADLSTPAVPAIQDPLPVLPPPAVTPKKPVAPKKIRKAPRKVEVRKEEIRYVVKKGDSLSRIAYRFGLKIRTLKEYNNLKKNVIHPKQVLLIPPTASADKVSANLKDVKNPAAKGKKAGKRKGAAIPADGIHKVKARENFTTIARQYGVTVADMVAANPGVDSARLKVGQKLNIVAGAGKEEGAVAAVPAPAGKKVAKKAEKKNVKKAAVKEEMPVKEEAKKVVPATDDVAAPDDDLFKEIKSPEEAAVPAAPAAPAAPAEKAAPAAEKPVISEAPAETNDILSSDESSSAKVDKVVTTPDGKVQITLAEATTLENFAAKYQTTAELLRKDNASLPASGELKAGTVITLSNIQ